MKTTIQVFLAITILLCIGVSISGAQIVSNGTGGGNWSSASTWAGGLFLRDRGLLPFDLPTPLLWISLSP